MKKLLITLTLALSAILPSMGQNRTGYQVDSLFFGHYDAAKVTVVKGEKLGDYNLEEFQSVRFPALDEDLNRASFYIREDMKRATNIEKDEQNGFVTYALLTFGGSNDSKREYIGYQVKEDASGKKTITVVYMYGKATRRDLDRIFKKR